MTRFQMLLKEETGAGFLARMAVMLPVFQIGRASCRERVFRMV